MRNKKKIQFFHFLYFIFPTTVPAFWLNDFHKNKVFLFVFIFNKRKKKKILSLFGIEEVKIELFISKELKKFMEKKFEDCLQT